MLPDRKALKLSRWLHGGLILMDRGYCDRKLFAQIEDRKGFFIGRMKKSIKPRIVAIRCGLSAAHIGESLGTDITFGQRADFDAEFIMPGGGVRRFRLIRLEIYSEDKAEPTILLFATNLRPDQFGVDEIATIYRLRWEIERLFKVMKTVGRLDQLRSANPDIIAAFMYAALIAVVISMHICATMRTLRPHMEPSLHRVTMLLLGYLPQLISSMGTVRWRVDLRGFEYALWREGTNPNPGRPYTITLYELDLA